MAPETFKQTSSLIRQLRTLVTVVALFFMLGFLGIFFSSRNTIQSLTQVNLFNDVYSITTQALQVINTSSETLEKALVLKNLSDARFVFISGQKIALEKIKEAISKSQQYPLVLTEFENTLKAVENFNHSAISLFDKRLKSPRKYTTEQLRTELLIAKTFRLEAEETMRRGRIEIKKYGENAFEIAFKKRYLPLWVAMIITILSLGYVGIIGVSISKNFDRSITNLSDAAAIISRGNLDIQAKILKQDEIGCLTHAFNQMVKSLKENRDQLNQAIQVRDDFISIASHELRTPLTPLKMQMHLLKKYLEGAAEQFPKGKELEQVVQSADRQLERIILLVENLLDVSRISRGNLTLNREDCDLGNLVKEIVGRYKIELERARCELKLDLQTGVVGKWDLLRIEQLVVNLLNNAIKYGAGKPIEIRVFKEAEKAKFTIRDHGIGIEKKAQSKIFERFARAVPITSYGGLGLGLFISKQIVQAHGGSIRVESEEGKGSIFIVELTFDEVKEV